MPRRVPGRRRGAAARARARPRRLLIRIIETTTGQTWHHVRRDLERLHAVTFTGPTGMFRQRTDPTKAQIDLYARLDLPLPKKIIEITPAGH